MIEMKQLRLASAQPRVAQPHRSGVADMHTEDISETVTRIACGARAFILNVICAGACAWALTTPATGQSASTPSESTGRTTVKLDPEHPPKFGEQYYPTDSTRHHEEGKCVVRMEVSSNGDVLAEQLLVSTGFPNLDSACVLAFLGGHFLPATLNGKSVTSWVNIPTIWSLGSSKRSGNNDFSSTPKIADDYQLESGPEYYPLTALQMKLKGNCIVQTLVDENGAPVNVTLTKSTGFATLDQACILAIKHAQFIPAKKDGHAIQASMDILLDWKLPGQN
jgi:TonB family protein